ncbi:fumarylacetoacetate hydrolase family protein [Paraburkholderia sediminicola]|uniref:Fumarylacetoacetate hydrolase family protein n=1 Tax=Paraburkholderia rhynchosiae TaxID=487049 RepID=A0ACC7NMB0_9BURK
MKLIRYGAVGAEKPGLIAADGTIRSLSPVIGDIGPDQLAPESLRALAGLDTSALPVVEGDVRYGVPVAGIREVVAIGLNYKQHAIEAGMKIPTEPMIFSKAVASLSGANDDILLYRGSETTDWEVELGIVIGRDCDHVSQEEALNYVAGYVNVNDVSERTWQIDRGGQFFKGKSAKSFCPVGPWLVTADEVGDPQKLGLRLTVNGETMQDGNTSDMIFPVAEIISCVSHHLPLRAGDLIITGTPAGVGMGFNPRKYLKAGDVVEQEVDGLGVQRHQVVSHSK